jgi:molybdopterin converting factor small subunit
MNNTIVTLQFDSRLLVIPLSDDILIDKIGKYDIRVLAPAGKSVNQTLKDLDIQLSQSVAALVNGQATDLEKPLKSGDQVRLLPQIAGGD